MKAGGSKRPSGTFQAKPNLGGQMKQQGNGKPSKGGFTKGC